MRQLMRGSTRAFLILGILHGMVYATPMEDWYYPQEEPAERAAVSIPRLMGIEGETAILTLDEGAAPARVAVGEQYQGWQVMTTLPESEGMVVLEKAFPRWGMMVYLNQQGTVAEIRKSVGDLEAIRGPRYELSNDYFNTVVESNEDFLANQVLESGCDPSYESLVGMLAPNHAYTFLGTPESTEKHTVQYDGKIGILPIQWGGDKPLERVLLDPNTVFSRQVDLDDPRAMKRGLLGRYLPAVNYGCFDPEQDFGWEVSALMPHGQPNTTLARLRASDGQLHYYRLHPRLPEGGVLEDGKAFYQAVLESHQYWESFFDGGAQWNVPHSRVEDTTRAGIVRALSGCVGLHPKYGMGGYWGGSNDGFPPTVLSLGTCLLDWGYTQAARDRLEYYFTHFVRPDGTLDYYGPAVSEYGQLLDLGVAVARKTGDSAWFDRQRPALEKIAGHLLGLRQQGLSEQSPADLSYGLLFGPAEADNSNQPDYYFSSSAWAWRGLREVGTFYVELGQKRDDPQLEARGQELLSECEALRQDILRSVERCVVADGQQSFLPPTARGNVQPFDRMTQDRFAWYTNYRYWPELLSSGCLTEAQEQMLIEYRRNRAGECLGMTRFKEDELDDWPYYHHAQGILSNDEIEHYLLGYFAHMAHHQMQGTFTAYEHVYIRGQDFRREYADYCVPSQLTVSLMTRWMLVHEDADNDDLWLCRAVPREWFVEGLSFSDVPTRWGPVSVSVVPDEDFAETTIHITPPPSGTPTLVLPMRFPKSWSIAECEIAGAHHGWFDAAAGLVRLMPQDGPITVTVRFTAVPEPVMPVLALPGFTALLLARGRRGGPP